MLKAILAVFLLFAASAVRAETLTETWYLTQAKTNFEIGNFKAAAEAYAKATQLNPKNAPAWKALGTSYERQGLIDQAVAAFDKFLALDADDPQVLFRQANILSWERYKYRRADALTYFKKGLSLHDDSLERRRYAKALAQDKKDLDEATVQYERLIKENPNDQTLRKEYRELLLWDKKHVDEAIAAYEDELQKSPQDKPTARALAMLYLSTTRHDDKGLALSKKVLTENPNDHELQLGQARALTRQGKWADAEDSYRDVLQRNDRVTIREEYAAVLAKDGTHRDEAIKQWRVIVKAQPKNDGARMKLAQALASKKADLPDAIEQFKVVVQHNPKNAEAHAGLARAYAWSGNKDQAIYHNGLAKELGYRKGTEWSSLDQDLHRGREPYVGPTAGYYYDERNSAVMQSAVLVARAGKDLSAFASGSIEAGGETYQEEDKDDHQTSAAGALIRGRFEYRFTEKHKASAKLGFHSVGSPGSNDEWEVKWHSQGTTWDSVSVPNTISCAIASSR